MLWVSLPHLQEILLKHALQILLLALVPQPPAVGARAERHVGQGCAVLHGAAFMQTGPKRSAARLKLSTAQALHSGKEAHRHIQTTRKHANVGAWYRVPGFSRAHLQPVLLQRLLLHLEAVLRHGRQLRLHLLPLSLGAHLGLRGRGRTKVLNPQSGRVTGH